MRSVYDETSRSMVMIERDEDGPDEWHISSVRTPPVYRRMGIASRLLRQLCDQADRERQALTLVVVPEGGPACPTEAKLQQWYASFGFEVEGDYFGEKRPVFMKRVPA